MPNDHRREAEILEPDGRPVPFDPLSDPRLYEGVILRRVVANVIDWVLILTFLVLAVVALGIFNILTLGLFTLFSAPAGALVPILPAAYFGLFTGGPDGATPGMNLLRIEVRSWNGERATMPQAIVRAIVYIVLLPLWPLLVIPFFNERRRMAHDFLSGSLVVNRTPELPERERR